MEVARTSNGAFTEGHSGYFPLKKPQKSVSFSAWNCTDRHVQPRGKRVSLRVSVSNLTRRAF